MELFHGRDDAKGWGEGGVWREGPSFQDYETHLRGEKDGLGIFPLLDNASVHFAAIDLDEPDFEAAVTMAEMLPGQAWVERSRSGNAHVWVFFKEPVEAWVARGVLRFAAEAAGYPRVELFPKQDQLKPGMVGNYINLPYHGHERPVLDGVGGWLARENFILLANERRTNPDLWRAKARELGIAPPEWREGAEFGTSPTLHMCAIHIIQNAEDNPIREPGRNIILFKLASQLLNWESATDEWAWEQLVRVNAAAEPEPLPEPELQRIFANAKRGEYTSTGCDDPYMEPYVHPDCPIANNARKENPLVR